MIAIDRDITAHPLTPHLVWAILLLPLKTMRHTIKTQPGEQLQENVKTNALPHEPWRTRDVQPYR